MNSEKRSQNQNVRKHQGIEPSEKVMTNPVIEAINARSWKIMMALSIVFIVFSLFLISQGNNILSRAFELAGSTQATADIEKSALDFLNMSMLKPVWEGIWMGAFGLLVALGLKEKKKYAWTLGMLWGIMMLGNATIQGGYEMLILGWSSVCPQTYMFLFLGIVALTSLSVTRKELS